MGVYRREYWLSWILVDLLVVLFVTGVILLALYFPIFRGEPGDHAAASGHPTPLVALILLLHGVEIIAFTCLIANCCPNASFGVSIGLLARLLIASIVSEMAIYGVLFEHVAYSFVPGAPLFIFMDAKVTKEYSKTKICKMSYKIIQIYCKFN
jgi:hypothetical protein